MWKIVHVDETDSTNRYVRELDGSEDVCVWTDYQTAGRGCGTNKWESERGKNLLFSVRCHPGNVEANHQFLLLEAMSLAVKDVLESCVSEGTLSIKWPNDIYWNDRKLAGTLTECGMSGRKLTWCVIGTGLNVNQEEFHSDAPNPVSLLQITGNVLGIEPLLQQILSLFAKHLKTIENGSYDELQAKYTASLYRREGCHSFRDARGDFQASIVAVKADGTLVLRDAMQQLRHYQFKEVSFIIS